MVTRQSQSGHKNRGQSPVVATKNKEGNLYINQINRYHTGISFQGNRHHILSVLQSFFCEDMWGGGGSGGVGEWGGGGEWGSGGVGGEWGSGGVG